MASLDSFIMVRMVVVVVVVLVLLLSFVCSSCGCFRGVFLATACGSTSRKDETMQEVRIVSLDT